MKTVTVTPDMAKDDAPRVVALGFFDGLHSGHRALLFKARQIALSSGLEFAVFTFTSEGEIKRDAPRLYSTKQRLALFEDIGAETVFLADFKSVAGLGAEQFVRDLLVESLGARIAVAGYNFRFAKGASAGADELEELMQKHGGRAEILPPYLYRGEPISTSQVRLLLKSGEIEEANRMLGAPYFLTGTVEHGRGRGHGFGFPTLNLSHEGDSLLPKCGVYRSLTVIDGAAYPSVTNVGVCPTVGERPVHSETHIIDREVDAYGKSVRVYLLGYLREEKHFSSEKELIKQINIDKNATIQKYMEEKETLNSLLGISV